jgi:hypothetical protein
LKGRSSFPKSVLSGGSYIVQCATGLDVPSIAKIIDIAQARFNPAPVELLELRAALRGNQEDTNQFIMARECRSRKFCKVISGDYPKSRFAVPRSRAGFDCHLRGAICSVDVC